MSAASFLSRFPWLISLTGLALLSAALAGSAQGQGAPQTAWRMPTLNPFAGKAPDNRPLATKVIDPFGLIPGNSTAKSSTASFNKQPPSMLQKMTTGTRRMANQTADFLNPFDDAKPQVREERVTGNNSMFNSQANQRPVQAAKEQKGWSPGWFSSNSVEKKPKTVNEFLAQPPIRP